MAQESEIDMVILRKKIVEGITSIQNKNENSMQRQAILFIGDTGVGKSTLLNYLIGNDLRVEQVGLKPCLSYRGNANSNLIKIGHDKYSQTSVPVKIIFDNMAIYDCPGFNDNKSREQQIANSFYYQRLMSLYQKSKLVIVIDESYLTETRAHQMPSLAKKLQSAFGNLENVRQSTLIVVNKCDSQSTTEDVEKQFRKLLTAKQLFSQQQINYFQFLLVHKQLFCFKQPKRSQIGAEICQQQRVTFAQKIKQLQFMGKIDIKNIISDVAKLAIRDHLDIIAVSSSNCISDLMQKIRKVIFSSKTGLYQIKEQIIKVFDFKNQMNQKNDFTPFFNFCIQRKINCEEINKFKSDLQIVQFFSKVYTKQKTQSFYLSTISLILTNLSMILQKIDMMIQDQKLEAQRKKRKQQRRIQQLRLKQLQQNKQNTLPLETPSSKASQKLFANSNLSTIKNSNIFRPSFNSTFSDGSSKKSILPLESKLDQPLVLSFHRKLLNTQLKIKEISYGFQDFHTKVAHFSQDLDRFNFQG